MQDVGVSCTYADLLPLCPFAACPPGSYKMSSRQQECFPCPANSVAEEDGSVVCVCKEDHFRTPLDTPSAPCTSNPLVHSCLKFDVMCQVGSFSRFIRSISSSQREIQSTVSWLHLNRPDWRNTVYISQMNKRHILTNKLQTKIKPEMK